MFKSLWRRLFANRPAVTLDKSRSPRASRAVLCLERLEDRLTPADLTPSIVGTTLTLTEAAGFSDNSNIASSGSFQQFTVTSTGGTNYTTPTRVTAIVLRLSNGSDIVTFNGATAGVINLPGGLTVSGTGGNKTIVAQQLTLPGTGALNISLTGPGTENTTLTDVNVGGATTISHTGSGNTALTIATSGNNATATNSWGSLTVTNGTGSDINTIQDTNFSGSVTINNGAGATSNTAQFGGSQNIFSAGNNKGLLSITGNLTINTTNGQSDSEVFDYNVHGGVNINAGAGITGQTNANFIGLENNQTNSGSGLPVIGGTTTLSGAAVGAAGLTVDVGGTTGNDFPIVLHGNLAVNVTGNGSATVTLNDINAAAASMTSINLGSTTTGNTVNIFGDQATATLGSLTITSAAAGTNAFNLQTQKGTLDIAGSAMLTFSAGIGTVNVGSVANTGVVETTGNFGVGGSATNIVTTAQNDTFGGLNFAMVNGSATTTFTDDNVTGAATVNHTGTGNTTFAINVSTSNANLLNNWNSLSISNGTGQDINTINDTDFAGNVSINNGAGATGFTGQFGGGQTIFSAAKNKGLLTVSGSLSISTGTGQSDSEVFDYNVHGGLNVNAGAGITGQGTPNTIGIEAKQTTAGSGAPVIGGTSTISGGGPAGIGLVVNVGTDGSSDFPIVLHGNLAINATGAGPAIITLNDINATSGTTDSISLGSTTSGDTVNIRGDKATTILGALSITSAATGNNTFNLQAQQGTLDIAGSALLTFSGGVNTVTVGSIANSGIVQTTGNFGVGGSAGTINTTAVNSTFGGVNSSVTGKAIPTTTFTDVNVTGPATISQMSTANTALTINASSSNKNALNNWNSLTITNGTGSDATTINDTDFSGNVSISNGPGATSNTAQFGGSHTVLSAAKNKGLLTIGGNLSISTSTGQSDSEVFDYHVHGNVSVTTGTGIAKQTTANFVGIENSQTAKGSGVPVIDGSVTITGSTVAGLSPGLIVDMGTDGSSGHFPLTVLGNLTVNASGTGAATIDVNDLNVANGTTTVTLAATTSNDVVAIQGASVTSVFKNLTITSSATGSNFFDLQDAKGTMQVTGTTNVMLGSGNDTLDLAADPNNPNGVSGAMLQLFGTSTFDGGLGTNHLFDAPNTTLFFITAPTFRHF
jgi:hypothetical protein